MKYLLNILFFVISLQVNSQVEENIELKKTFEITNTDQSISLSFPEKKTITLDTTIVKIDSSQLKFLKEFSLLDNETLTKNYKRHVFGNYKSRTIGQFINPIIIYFDENLPKEIKSNFKDFILDIPEIENLKFSFTKNIEEANYFIDIAEEEVSAYSKKDRKELSEKTIENYTFSQMTYKLYNNNNGKYMSCRYLISPSIINNSLFLTKLKKGFIISLGGFIESYRAPKESFLNSKPDVNNIYLSNYDIMVLKYHYNYILPFKVNSNGFETLKYLRHKMIN